MRTNVYAEELYDLDEVDENFHHRVVEVVKTKVKATGLTFFGARLFLKSATELHNTPDDDDRSAITIWGPRAKVAKLLRKMADEMEAAK